MIGLIGGGNGEAKLYIGQDGQETRNFFGGNGFAITCFLLKQDLQKYLDETKIEYLKPEQPYINKENLPNLWNERKAKIDALPEKIEFEVVEHYDWKGSFGIIGFNYEKGQEHIAFVATNLGRDKNA